MTTTLTFSRVELALRPHRGSSPEYLTHQLVADLLGDRPDRGYLYRVTHESRDRSHVQLLLLSDGAPVPAPHNRAWGQVLRVDTKPFAPRLKPGDLLDFEVRLNATAVVTLPNGRKRRTDIWDAVFTANRNDPRSPHDVYGAYLARKLDGVAEVLDARVTARGQVRARRAGEPHPITFVATNVAGILRVTDPDAFINRLAAGVGRAKAFGCGLLCLSRPGTVLPRRHVPVGTSS